MTDEAWTLALTAAAQRELDRLPGRVEPAMVGFLVGSLLDNPERVGKRLGRELIGYLSARRGDYRIIFRLDESHRTVVVVRIAHRSHAYRSM